MATRKILTSLALLATLVSSGAWATDCAPEGGTPGPIVAAKGQHIAIEVDWPEDRKTPVTISYKLPTNLTHANCELGYRIVHRVQPPFICDAEGYTGGEVTITALQNDPGLMDCAIFLGWMHREVDRHSTRKAGELLRCRLADVGPI